MSYNEARWRRRAFEEGIRSYWGKDPTHLATTIIWLTDGRLDPVRAFAVPDMVRRDKSAVADGDPPEASSGRGRSGSRWGRRAPHPLAVEDIVITDRW